MDVMVTLAQIIPTAEPTRIPGAGGTVSKLFGYGLWILLLSGVVGVGIGAFKLAVSDKSRGGGGGSEPFKWMAGGIGTVMLSGSLITILNGIVAG